MSTEPLTVTSSREETSGTISEGQKEVLSSQEGISIQLEENSESEPSEEMMTTDELYSGEEGANRGVKKALPLLCEAIKHSEKAIDDFDSNQPVGANNEMEHLRPLVAELFECRSIGEGYAGVTNALLFGMRNMQTEPFTKRHAQAARWALTELRDRPFMGYEEEALDLIIMLEEAGYTVESTGLGQHVEANE